jgi:murein DD-endopeptidase MepM/ murein hydrolase activator NlpD
MGTRMEEYLRRMRERGYQDSLMGMDDDDIDYELAKMEEAERRREAQVQQSVRTVYRSVDPGLKARILRMFGQPYDESAIPEGQKFYLSGWDNGEEDKGPLPIKTAPGAFGPSQRGTISSGEQDNYWDSIFKRNRAGNIQRNWFQPASWGAGKASGLTWMVDPLGMFPQYDPSSGGDISGSEARNRYRDTEVVKTPDSEGCLEAGGSRNNEARSGTADNFTFTSDPLESIRVRGGAKSNTYGWVRQNNDGTPRPHQGVDIYAKPGTPVLSVEDGKVIDVDYDKDYGDLVKIEFERNGKKYYAFYAHLSEKAVKVGDSVRAGQIIGRTGTSGNAKGLPAEDAHLHFEVHTQPGYRPKLEGRRDPMPHFRSRMEVDKNK